MPKLYILNATHLGQWITFAETPFYIGRTVENEFVCQEAGVSRKHAVFEKEGADYYLKDLDSNNGTFVNGQKISRILLNEGDEIKISTLILLFVSNHPSPEILNKISQLQDKENKGKAVTRRLAPNKDGTPKEVSSATTLQSNLVLEIGNIFTKPQDLESLCHEAVNHILCTFVLHRCFLFLWDEISRELEPYIYRPVSLKPTLESVIERERLSQLVSQQKISLKNFPATANNKAMTSLLIPMIVQGNLVGALQFDFLDQDFKFSNENLPFFKGLTNQIALGVYSYQQTQSLVTAQQHTQKLSKFVSPEVLKNILKSDEMDIQVENTLCTILFSDIQGFTAMAERLPPRRLAKLLNEYFSQMVTILFAHNGSLDKFIGDAIMAIFGAPISREDDADRAVATAIEMQQAIHKMNQKRIPEEQFNVRIGINTGYCVAGRIGSYQRMEYTVLGDTVNLASRIESNGKAGSVIIGEATRALLNPAFETLELEPIRVKNKTNPIRIFEVKFSLT